MEIYRHSTIELFFHDGAGEPIECVVKLEEDRLLVEYEDDVPKGFVQYVGTEGPPNTYKLAAPEVNGKATMHRDEEENVLIGSWYEDGEQGLWRIYLEDAPTS